MLSFPASPSTGQTYTASNGIIYTYKGTGWKATGGGSGSKVTLPANSAGKVLYNNNGTIGGLGTTDGFNVTLSGYIEINCNVPTDNLPQAYRMRGMSGGMISFYDVKDPDIGIFNYTLEMDGGLFSFRFSSVNSPYDYGISKTTIDYLGNIVTAGTITAAGFSGPGAGSGLGTNQTWQDLTASRSANVTYTNSTGSPIFISVCTSGFDSASTMTVDGLSVSRGGAAASWESAKHDLVIPNGSTYMLTIGNGSLQTWFELRT